MKERAVDESLGEEARESAKRALGVLVSSELLDIEQAAALKKRSAALKDIESEAEFERLKAKAEAQAERLKARDEAEGQQEAAAEAEMVEWLGRHRLRRHADTIARVAGPCEPTSTRSRTGHVLTLRMMTTGTPRRAICSI